MKCLKMSLACSSLVISTLSPAQLKAEDWIGLDDEPLTQLGYAYSRGQDDSDSHQLSVLHELDDETDLSIQYSYNKTATDTEDFAYDHFFAQLGWLSAGNLRLGINYQYQGKQQELEITNLGLLASYTLFPYIFSFEYRSGSLSAYTLSQINSPLVPDQIDSDMHSEHYSANWFYQDYGFYINHQQYHYEKNLSALNNQALLQALVKPGVLANSGLLLNASTSFGVTYYQDERELSWLLAHNSYEVDNSQSDALQFEWREVMQQMNIIYTAAITDDANDNLSFGIGFEWDV